jgi:K+-transporting ATPase KdpF subunit
MFDAIMLGAGLGFFFDRGRLCRRLRETVRDSMLLDYILAGGVTALLLGYLVYALVRPERF